MHKFVASKFQKQISIWLAIALTITVTVTADHVSVVSCAEDTNCLRRLDAEVAAALNANLRNSDPCTNFWEYACGNWTAAPFYDHVDTFGAIDNYYALRLRQYLEYDTPTLENTPPNMSKLLLKMRNVYQACTAVDSYFLPLQRYLQALHAEFEATPTAAQWPHSLRELQADGWSDGSRNFSWLPVIAELRRFGLNGVFFDESMGVAFNDATRPVIELKLPDEDGDGGEGFTGKYEILEYFAEFGWIEQEDAATDSQLKLVKHIFALETQLKDLRKKHSPVTIVKKADSAKKHASQDTQDDAELLSLQELRRQVPNIDWHAYFSILLGVQSPPSVLIIEVEGLAYLRDVAAMLAQTEDRVIAGYVLLRLCKYVRAIAPQITAKNCVDHMGVIMPLGVDYVYDRLVYGSERHERDVSALQAIFASLKAQFGTYLQRNRMQLNPTQQSYLRTKLERMQLRLGNLPQHMSIDFYNRYYEKANVSAVNFYRNHWELLRFRTQQQHDMLRVSSVTLDAFYVNDDIQQVRNAPYFVHQRNLLIVPLLFVQPPFFHHQLDTLLQYSLMGWILGHELNHAFETEGILLDAEGIESQVGAGIRARSEFQAAVQCLERQQPPSAALIERIADVGGLQLAYDAFFGASTAATQIPKTYAVDFSAPQLFFINFAQFFCGTLPRAIAHDRDDVRVMSTVAQLPEFAKAFGCRPHSLENPNEKCQMWRG